MSALAGLVEKGLVAPDWAEALAPVDEQIAAMGQFLREEDAAGRGYLPAGDRVLPGVPAPARRRHACWSSGRTPTPTPGHPIGLSFAVERHVWPLPPSLVNIYIELRDDLGVVPPRHGDLSAWADQGVMLLNRTLTVRPGDSDSHQGKGWEPVTERAIAPALAERGGPCAAVLWGRTRSSSSRCSARCRAWSRSTPPAVGARRGFFGSKPFSTVNRLLEEQGADAGRLDPAGVRHWRSSPVDGLRRSRATMPGSQEYS